MTQDVIDAINNGDPIKLYTQPTTAAYRRAQDPLIQACYRGNILEYIVTPDYANPLDSAENHRRWMERYESRCVINGKVCSPHNSCETCPYKDRKRPLLSPLEDYQKRCNRSEAEQRTSRNGHKLRRLSDPTADTAIRHIEQDELLNFLMEAGELYAKEYVLRKRAFKNKEIAVLLNRSESSITRDLKTVDQLIMAFYEDWNS